MTEPKKPDTKTQEELAPASRVVLEFHRNDDLDVRSESHHHSLGNNMSQAAFGGHIHDGQYGVAVLSGVVFTGSRSQAAGISQILNQICNALTQLGAVNNTSA